MLQTKKGKGTLEENELLKKMGRIYRVQGETRQKVFKERRVTRTLQVRFEVDVTGGGSSHVRGTLDKSWARESLVKVSATIR